MNERLGLILEWKFPGMADVGYSVYMTPDGAIGLEWHETVMGRPAPTEAELVSWELQAAKFYKRRELRRAREDEYRLIHSLDGEFMESERDALYQREYRQGYANLTAPEKARIDQAIALRNKLHGTPTAPGLLDQVNNAQTVAAVNGVSWGAAATVAGR